MAENTEKNQSVRASAQQPQPKKEDEKIDTRDRDVERLKKTVNAVRHISVVFAIIAIVFFVISELSKWNLLAFQSFFVVVFFLGLYYTTHCLKIVFAFENAVTFRFGKDRKVKKPGLRWMWWLIETIKFVRMYQQELDIPEQQVTTTDGVALIDGLVTWKVFDAPRFLVNVGKLYKFLTDLSEAGFREAAGIRTTDQLRADTDKISKEIAKSLNISVGFCGEDGQPIEYEDSSDIQSRDDREKSWGVQVLQAKLTRTDPPKEVSDAMAKLAAAGKEAETIVKIAEAEKKKRVLQGEGEAAFNEQVIKSLGPRGSDKYVAMEVAKTIKPGDKIIISGDILEGLRDFFGAGGIPSGFGHRGRVRLIEG